MPHRPGQIFTCHHQSSKHASPFGCPCPSPLIILILSITPNEKYSSTRLKSTLHARTHHQHMAGKHARKQWSFCWLQFFGSIKMLFFFHVWPTIILRAKSQCCGLGLSVQYDTGTGHIPTNSSKSIPGHWPFACQKHKHVQFEHCKLQSTIVKSPQVVVGRLKPQECANSKARYLTGKEANLDHRNRIFLERSNRIMSDQKQYFLEFKGKKSFLGAFSILALWGQTVVRSFRQRFFAPNVFAIFHFIFGSFPFLRYLRRCGIKF